MPGQEARESVDLRGCLDMIIIRVEGDVKFLERRRWKDSGWEMMRSEKCEAQR